MYDNVGRVKYEEYKQPKGRGNICPRCKKEKIEFDLMQGVCLDCARFTNLGHVGDEITKKLR